MAGRACGMDRGIVTEDFGSVQPIVNEVLDAVRYRDRSNVSGLADQVDDGPMVLAPWKCETFNSTASCRRRPHVN
jgi:hypothetical protein